MRRTGIRALEVLVLPTAALVGVLLLAPGRAELAVHVYVLVLLAAGLGAVVGAIAGSQDAEEPSGFDAALRRTEDAPERLAELARLEREAALARSCARSHPACSPSGAGSTSIDNPSERARCSGQRRGSS